LAIVDLRVPIVDVKKGKKRLAIVDLRVPIVDVKKGEKRLAMDDLRVPIGIRRSDTGDENGDQLIAFVDYYRDFIGVAYRRPNDDFEPR